MQAENRAGHQAELAGLDEFGLGNVAVIVDIGLLEIGNDAFGCGGGEATPSDMEPRQLVGGRIVLDRQTRAVGQHGRGTPGGPRLGVGGESVTGAEQNCQACKSYVSHHAHSF
jgi:hypothetical protein